MNFTPGEWRFDTVSYFDEAGEYFKVTDVQDVTIADVPVNSLDPIMWALGNAYLIAAAPDLYDALRDLVTVASPLLSKQHAGNRIYPEEWSILYDSVNRARAALKKADWDE